MILKMNEIFTFRGSSIVNSTGIFNIAVEKSSVRVLIPNSEGKKTFSLIEKIPSEIG